MIDSAGFQCAAAFPRDESAARLSDGSAARLGPVSVGDLIRAGVAWPLPSNAVGSAVTDRVRVTRLADVQPEVVKWLWQGRLPAGKLVVLDGDPGLGKSTLALDLAARISTGAAMPDGTTLASPGSVVILSAEDGLADTIRPRLDAAGADVRRVVTFAVCGRDGERGPKIPGDLAHLERVLRHEAAVLVIIDPLVAHLDGSVNSWRDQDVRRALGPLATIAELTGAAILAIRHLTKATGGSPLYRGGGSIGITGAARATWLVAPDPETLNRRVLVVVKSNLAPIPPGLTYRVDSAAIGEIATSRIVWEGTSGHTAASLLAVPPHEETRSALDDAKAVLSEILAHGSVGAGQVRRAAREAGVSDRTLDRAKSALGIRSVRPEGFTGPWHWTLAGPVRRQPDGYVANPGSGDVQLRLARYGAADAGGRQPADLAIEEDYPESAWGITEEPRK